MRHVRFHLLTVYMILLLFALLSGKAMADYASIWDVDISSYDAFKATTENKEFDVDGNGPTCVDGAKVLWNLVGQDLYTGDGRASGIWEQCGDDNAGAHFDMIYNLSDVIRGDIVVFGYNRNFNDYNIDNGKPNGHVAFADNDYQEGIGFNIYGQNQAGCKAFSVQWDVCTDNFLGAFRLKAWEGSNHRQRPDMSYATQAHILLGSNQNAALAVNPTTGYVEVAEVADTATQLWRFEKLSDGSYYIVSRYNGKVLDVEAGGYNDGTRVQVYDGSYQYNQKWIVYYENGHHIIVPQYTRAKCLDVDNGSSQPGTKVQVWTANETVSQQFYVFNRNTTSLPTSLNIGSGDIELGQGKTTQLTGSFSPADVIDTRKGITWTTSNSAVATVSSSGLVTGVGNGTATITATSVFNPTLTASRKVKVENAIETPQITAFNVNGRTIHVEWTESSLTGKNDVRRYELYIDDQTSNRDKLNNWSASDVIGTSYNITMPENGNYRFSIRATNKTDNTYSSYSRRSFTIIDRDWLYTKSIPENVDDAEIQYLNHYEDKEQAESPGAGWTKGASHTTYTDGSVIYSEALDPLQESDSLVYIGNFYYHYCDGNNEVEHFETPRFRYLSRLDDNGQFDIVYSKQDGSDARYTVYCLKWNSGEYAGYYATCPNGPYNESMALYYRGRRYQQRNANVTYTWSKEDSWSAEQDSNADSVSYRIRTTTETPLSEHTLTKHPRIEASCKETGTEEYWECKDCGKLFADEDAQEEIEKPTVIPLSKHTLTKHTRIEASCKETGTEEYWECKDCGKLFADEDAQKEIEKPVIIPLGEHTLEYKRMVLPTYDKEGLSEGIYCSVCGKVLQEQEVLPRLERPLPGDVNGDHVVDGRDVIRLMKWLADDPEEEEGDGIYYENADVDASGHVDEKDLLRLIRYLAGENVTLEVGYVSGNG